MIQIVIPVYNSLSQTRQCVQSVIENSTLPFHLILVNDRSDLVTSEYLREVSADSRVTLLENEENLGFLDTANRGMAFALSGQPSEFKILLNSDTLVPPGWLEAFKSCFDSDPKIAIASPLSNNAENLSLSMPEGFSYMRFAKVLSQIKPEGYPDVTTAVGFCMAVRTSAWSGVNGFDPIFAPGYGEESDLHFRILSKGLRSVLVPNCYVYHESHASFSDRKMDLVRRNRPIFDDRWKQIYLNELQHHEDTDPVGQVAKKVEALELENEHDVVFILPTARLFGGVVVVYSIVNRLLARGVKAAVVVLSESEEIKARVLFSPYFIPKERAIKGEIPKAETYVATHFDTVPFAFKAYEKYPESKLVYLVQGYEGWFPGANIQEVVETYRSIPNRLTVSSWLSEMLNRWEISSKSIPNGIDSYFFTPGERYPYSDQSSQAPESTSPAVKPLRVLLMLRNDPQAGWKRGLRIMQAVKERAPETEFVTVGSEANCPEAGLLATEIHREASRTEMRAIYQSVDLFIDCSMVQGFGLMGLEAMASGVATVMSATGGVQEYADQVNSVLCPLGDERAIVSAVLELISDRAKLNQLKRNGRATALKFDWEPVADRYCEYLSKISTEGEGISTPNYQALSTSLLLRILSNKATTVPHARLEELAEILVKELRSAVLPESTQELLAKQDQAGLLKIARTRYEAGPIIKIYEHAIEELRVRHEAAIRSENYAGLDVSVLDRVKIITSS